MPCIIISPLSLAWLVSHPEHTLLEKPSLVLFSQQSEEKTITESGEFQPLDPSQDHLDFVDKSLRSLDALMKDGSYPRGFSHLLRRYEGTGHKSQ